MTTKVKMTKTMMRAEHEAMEAGLDAEFAMNVQGKMLEAVVLAAKLEQSSLDAGWGELSANLPSGDAGAFHLLVSASHQFNRELGPANFSFGYMMTRAQYERNFQGMVQLKEEFDEEVAERARAAFAKQTALAKLSPEDRKALGL